MPEFMPEFMHANHFSSISIICVHYEMLHEGEHFGAIYAVYISVITHD